MQTIFSGAARVVGETQFVTAGPIQGYDANGGAGRRKQIIPNHRSEDDLLRGVDRSKLLANARDITRNFSLAQWIVTQHLNYVTNFNFHAGSKDKGFNRAFEERMRLWSLAENCDLAGRHSLNGYLRLIESSRVIDGDVGVSYNEIGKIQGIEGDRIRQPDVAKYGGRWINGVRVDAAGRELAYAIWRRKENAFEFERLVSARNFALIAYRRRFDQIRGTSLLAPALNSIRDVYENIDHALARAKVSHLFALVIKRAAFDDDRPLTDYDGIDVTKGPSNLDMNPGDEANFLESHQPSSEFQAFMEQAIMLAIRALDIPMSMFREDFTNFFGSKAAGMHYERSCKFKREGLVDWLNDLTRWLFFLWITDGSLVLPKNMDPADAAFNWVATGTPWWDPAKEIAGKRAAIGLGLSDPLTESLEVSGETFYRNIDRTVEALRYVQEVGADVGLTIRFDTAAPAEPVPDPNAKGK